MCICSICLFGWFGVLYTNRRYYFLSWRWHHTAAVSLELSVPVSALVATEVVRRNTTRPSRFPSLSCWNAAGRLWEQQLMTEVRCRQTVIFTVEKSIPASGCRFRRERVLQTWDFIAARISESSRRLHPGTGSAALTGSFCFAFPQGKLNIFLFCI